MSCHGFVGWLVATNQKNYDCNVEHIGLVLPPDPSHLDVFHCELCSVFSCLGLIVDDIRLKDQNFSSKVEDIC